MGIFRDQKRGADDEPNPTRHRLSKAADECIPQRGLVAEARKLNINVSRACEAGLEQAVREARARQWQEENAAGFEAWNSYVERNGIPLAKYRKF